MDFGFYLIISMTILDNNCFSGLETTRSVQFTLKLMRVTKKIRKNNYL